MRHPGYTAILLLIIGAVLVGNSSNSYLHECNIMSTLFGWPVVAWVVFEIYVVVSLMKRSRVEDVNLRATFGKAWDRYSRAVPWRFIPGIF